MIFVDGRWWCRLLVNLVVENFRFRVKSNNMILMGVLVVMNLLVVVIFKMLLLFNDKFVNKYIGIGDNVNCCVIVFSIVSIVNRMLSLNNSVFEIFIGLVFFDDLFDFGDFVFGVDYDEDIFGL